jgi:hypothetical protein
MKFLSVALTPGKLLDNKPIDTIVALAHKGVLMIFDLGYFKIKALARIVATNAYFLRRLNHQVRIFAVGAGGVQPVDLTHFLKHVAGEVWPPAGNAGMLQGRFRGLRSRGAGAKIAFEFPILTVSPVPSLMANAANSGSVTVRDRKISSEPVCQRVSVGGSRETRCRGSAFLFVVA